MVSHVLSYQNYAKVYITMQNYTITCSQKSAGAKMGQQCNLKRTNAGGNQVNSTVMRRIRGFSVSQATSWFGYFAEIKNKQNDK